VLDKFDHFAISEQSVWQVTGTGVHIVQNTGRSTASLGAVYIPYSVDPPAWTYEEMERTALTFIPEISIDGTFYIDGWAQADFVPEGETAALEIWVLDEGTFLWGQTEVITASAQYWYNFHAEVSTSNGALAIAFLSSRSDEGSGGMFMDDVYLYGDLSLAPRCDGSYPEGTTIGSGLLPRDEGAGIPPFTIDWPANKPCPRDYLVPNNFWGPLLFQLAIFVEQTFAFSPYHEPSSITEMVRNFIGSPIAVYFGVASTFFDLRIPIICLLIVLALSIGRVVRGIWMIVKESIPFL
jgi:hypothetical protein